MKDTNSLVKGRETVNCLALTRSKTDAPTKNSQEPHTGFKHLSIKAEINTSKNAFRAVLARHRSRMFPRMSSSSLILEINPLNLFLSGGQMPLDVVETTVIRREDAPGFF